MGLNCQTKPKKEVQEGIQENIRQQLVVDLLLEFIFHSPALFEYAFLNEDARSGFLLFAHRALPKIIANYDVSKGNFFTYLVSDVRMLVKGYLRVLAKTRASEDSLSFCYETQYDKIHEVREAEPDYGVENTPRLVARNAEKTLLVLALKNAYSITEKQITVISDATGFEKTKLTSLVEMTRSSLLAKETMRQKMIESRNKAYYLKTRYRIELERLSPGTSQYCAVEKQYAVQVRLMEKKNELLKKHSNLTPSNTYVGSLLNIPARNVTRLITEAVDTFKSKPDRQRRRKKLP
jgi:hypothetical protein